MRDTGGEDVWIKKWQQSKTLESEADPAFKRLFLYRNGHSRKTRGRTLGESKVTEEVQFWFWGENPRFSCGSK